MKRAGKQADEINSLRRRLLTAQAQQVLLGLLYFTGTKRETTTSWKRKYALGPPCT